MEVQGGKKIKNEILKIVVIEGIGLGSPFTFFCCDSLRK